MSDCTRKHREVRTKTVMNSDEREVSNLVMIVMGDFVL